MTDQQLPNLEEWLNRVAEELDLPGDVVVPGPILAMTKDVAHGIVRPGAPTSSFLVGVALGRQLAEAEGTHPDPSTAAQLEGLTRRVSDLVYEVRAEAGLGEEAQES